MAWHGMVSEALCSVLDGLDGLERMVLIPDLEMIYVVTRLILVLEV